jgi:hypothetical protein
VQLLIKAINAHQQAQQQGQESAIIDDVPMEEIIEGTVGALHQLARDPHNGIVIRELKCIPVLVQLLFMNWESIQRVACGCLSELANDKQSTELIENEHATDRLTELLRSKDHAISTYAAAVLFRLSEDKPHDSNGMSSAAAQWAANGGMNGYDPATVYGESNNHRLSSGGAQDQYVSYNTIDPYEMQMQDPQQHYNVIPQLVDVPIVPSNQHQQHHQLNSNLQQQQSPATWFDTDL